MSSRTTLVLGLCAALLTGLVFGYLWGAVAGLLALCAAAACLALGRLPSAGDGRAASWPSPSSSDVPASETSGLAADALPPANPLLEATMNGMREGMLVVDSKSRVVVSNRSARDIFGHVGGELERKRLSEVTRNPDIHAAYAAALERGESAAVKVEMLGTDRLTFDLRVAPLSLGGGEDGRGAIGVFFDITRLERLERVRQEFLSNVSHELRTPLTAIIAYVETLEDGALEDGENAPRFLGIVRRNAERMHCLINDILELSAIEAGNVPVEPGRVRLRALVGDVLTAVASRASARRVSLRNEVAEGTVVYADARRLEQMLTNLIDNAVKFNREGGTVTVTHESRERDRISVADTGDGIPAGHLPRIFERFYRVDSARSRDMGGTGLGLAIVKHLARAHGGEVSVQSSPGEGTTFVIEFPAEPSENPEESAAAAPTAARV